MKSFKKYHSDLINEQEKLMKPLLKFTKNHIKARDLITLSSFPDVKKPLKKYPQLHPGAAVRKPTGIWFGIGDSWIDWLEYNMPHWAQPSILKIEPNFSKLFHVRNEKDLDVFTEKYSFKDQKRGDGTFVWAADWKKLSRDYDGIVHWKFPVSSIRNFSDDPRAIWYGWDVRSGCIWNPAAIKKMNIIGRYDEDKKEYVKI